MLKRLYSSILGSQDPPVAAPLNTATLNKREVKFAEKEI